MHDIDRNRLEVMEFGEFESEAIRISRRAAGGVQRRRADGTCGRTARGQGRAGAQSFPRGFDPESRWCARQGGQLSARAAARRHPEIVRQECRVAGCAGDQRRHRLADRRSPWPRDRKGLTTFGTNALNQEYEALNQEDREFEGAKQFVQLAANTVQHATAAPPGADPRAVARSAIIKAAQAVAPGLLQGRCRNLFAAARRARSKRRLVSPRQQDRPARRVSNRWHSIPTQERCCCTRRAPW